MTIFPHKNKGLQLLRPPPAYGGRLRQERPGQVRLWHGLPPLPRRLRLRADQEHGGGVHRQGDHGFGFVVLVQILQEEVRE